MLVKFGDTYLNLSEISRVQMSENSAIIELKNGNTFETSEGVDYFRTVLDAFHVINIQKLRGKMPNLENE